jgi:DNA repair protein SbcC/Rad50
MKLQKLTVSGITEAFPNSVTVDFEALGPGLIALVGENGVGKSTLIGSVFAALFRELPGQKRSLYDFCTNSQPEIDLTFSVNGNRYRSLLRIDPKSRQMEHFLFDGQGVTLASGKKDAYQEAIGRRIGTAEFFQASIFSNQTRTGNFLGLQRSERKQLFITELLGLERLRLISATARGLADQVGRQVLTLEGERKGITQLLSTASRVEDVDELVKQLETFEARLQEHEQLRGRVEVEQRDLQGREIERKSLESRRQDLSGQVDRVEGRIAELRKQVEEDERRLKEQHVVADVAQSARNLNARAEELHRRVEEVQAVEASNRETNSLARSVEADLQAKRDEFERSRVESAELDSVPCGGKGAYAACVKIHRAIQARQELPVLEGVVSTLELEVELQRGALVEVPASSSKLLKELQECERERRSLEALRKRHEELRMIQARQAERQVALEKLSEERSGLDAKLQEVVNVLTQSEELQTALNAARERAREVASAIGRCRAERDSVIARKAQAEQQLRQIETARAREAVIERELAEARMERDDFDYLAKAFGPDGIQLCEIQSAGPGVSAIVNDLLEGCFDNKFEVRFRTQRPKADGRGFVDDFDIEVRNKTLDRTCLVNELSGGQFVLVNEGVNLGIAIYNMRQGEGVRHETLFRDETVGALDAKNSREYVRMLRRAMAIGGFHQVIFICHAPRVWELADRILELRDGQVFGRVGGESPIEEISAKGM